MDSEWSARTRAVAAGRPHGPGEPLNTPIVPASTFEAGGDRNYSRENGTPTWEALEQVIGDLEGGHATAFASGIATLAAIIDITPVGAKVAVPTFSYAGSRGLLAHAHRTGRLVVTELPPDETDAWTGSDADLLWLESPTNPTLDVMDLKAIAAATSGRVVVDNTFATPLGQQPLSIGADIVVHSATKLIGGHSDLLLGLTIAAEPALAKELRDARTRNGATPGALEAYLALRGLRTLPVRLAEQTRTAATLAERLAAHPAVTKVRYPGEGMMIAFELPDAESADAVTARLRLIRRATSLGGVESVVERRAWLAGDAHVPAGLLRFSVGLEDPEDLWRDLASALG
ncbi:trans-sulfuration enzyme family protein [Amycolatopsis xylanica]|uniref:trans-sulfuration enzyme family protein n=1 Tax=Amycolatopsis xylanica TaxID=589385 RepID=UPI000B82E8B2|nr:PLP-dependent aspartate aminotransferase family protein [Amycolatopsis xylanica]